MENYTNNLFTRARKIFGNIDFENEIIVRNTYKKLAKKYHPDGKGGGNQAKIVELNGIFDELKAYYREVKTSKKDEAFKEERLEKERLEKELDTLNSRISARKLYFKSLKDDLKILEYNMNVIQDELDDELLYILFNKKSKKKKIITFFSLLAFFEAILVAFTVTIQAALLPTIIGSIIVALIFTNVFIDEMTKISETKKELKETFLDKQDLEKEMNLVSKEITRLTFSINDISNKLNQFEKGEKMKKAK